MKSIEIAERTQRPQPPPLPPEKPKSLVVELAKDFVVGAVALLALGMLNGRREDTRR